ncbi:MAG: MBL fold metallo-hydrolase [Candidatus Acidiferrum sp.]
MIILAPSHVPSRRAFLKSSSLLLGAAAVSSALPARLLSQDDSQRIDQLRKQISGPLQVSKVSGNVSMLSGAGGNIGILTGPEGKVVIDSGVSTSTPGVLQAISQLDASPLKYLINTHFHFDHTDGNAPFHAAGATILAHEKTRERLSSPQYMELFKLHFPAAAAAALPTRTLTDRFTQYVNGGEVVMQYVPPAHTDTDIFLHFPEADVIHAGDVFFNGMYPLFDYSSGGNVNGFVDAQAKILSLAKDSTKIIPGHGPLGSKADLTAAHDTVATIRDRVAAAKKSGKSLDETIASKPSAEFDAKFGKGMIGPDLIVTLVYKTL